MRRLLVFLLLFALGFAVLLTVQERQRQRLESSIENPPGIEPPTPLPTVPAEIEHAPEPEEEREQAIRTESRGRFNVREQDEATGVLLHEVSAENHVPIGNGAYDFEKFVAKQYRPETRALRFELRADQAHARMGEEGFDEDYPITLHTVEMILHEGPRFIPLRLSVPVLEGLISEQRFTSREPVRIEGTGLVATGLGLELDGKLESVLIVSDARVELALTGGGSAVLTSVGGLLIRTAPDGTTSILARRDARLVLTGDKPVDVSGDVIRILGHMAADDSSRFIARTAIAEGNVRIVPQPGTFAVDGTFSGQSAELSLSEEGDPLRATLEGRPVVDMILKDASDLQLPGQARIPQAGLPARISGAGPLTLEFEGRPAFDFAGPAQLEVPSLDAVLTAEENLHGSRVEDQVSVLVATGSAVGRSGALELESDVISARAETDSAGNASVRLFTTEPTTAAGETEARDPFTLKATGGLEYLYSAESERVTEARGVTLEVRGPDPFRARAQRVIDFDPEASSFVAEGDVAFEHAGGKGSADRVDAHSREHVELTGSPSRPARYEIPGGELSAARIEARQRTLSARGSVDMHWGVDGARHVFKSHWLELERLGAGADSEPAERFELKAGGSVQAELSGPDSSLRLSSDLLEASGLIYRSEESGNIEPSSIVATGILASGDVQFEYSSTDPDRPAELTGAGERLELDGRGEGRLLPALEDTVSLSGDLPTEGLSYSMVASEIEFSPERVIAFSAVADIQGVDVRLSPMGDAPEIQAPLRAVAGKLIANGQSLLFSDGVYLGQVAEDGQGWTLDSDKALLSGGEEVRAADGQDLPIHELLAWGGFRATFDDNIEAKGSKLRVDRSTNLVQIEGAPAQIRTDKLLWTSAWFEWQVDTSFLKSGQGRVQPAKNSPQSWSLTYESLEPLVGPDATIQVVREPNVTSGDRRLRASWALFWVDSEKWASMSSSFLEDDSPVDDSKPSRKAATGRNNLFAVLDASGVGEWMNEVYLEGNVEVLGLRPATPDKPEYWERQSRAEAVYVDLVDGHAMIRDVVTSGSMGLGSRTIRLKMRADWLRHSRDGSFQADRTVVTSCDFEEPHYEIRIGDLKMDPRADPKAEERVARRREQGLEHPGNPADMTDGWNVSSTNTGIAFGNGVSLPLPPLEFPLTDQFRIPRSEIKVFGLQPLSFGSDARFGTFIRAKFVRPLGIASKSIARGIDKVMGRTPRLPTGNWGFEPTLLGSRGLSLNVDHDLQSEGRYKIRNEVGLVPDSGLDRGLVRVPEGDRDSLRLWYRMRSRFLLGPEEWVDVVVTKQTDPGVQAEFYQSRFLRFEERESFVHWRKAKQLDFWRATAELQLDGHRTEVQEQPSFGYYRGRGQVGTLWGRPLNYTSDSEIARLSRVEGDPDYEPPFADGFGERDVLRFDTTQRLERPASLGWLGLIATPFLEARGTLWDDGADGSSMPRRAALSLGTEFGTSFWRSFSNGVRHMWAPALAVRGDLVHEQSGSTPATFDDVENPIDGRFVDLRLRSRLDLPANKSGHRRFFDLELTGTHAASVSSGAREGWLPVRINASYLDSIFGIPIGATHDGRYDIQSGNTVYSRTFIGIDPMPRLQVETGYHSGRRDDGELLYNAFSTAARYSISEKWQVEARQTISFNGNERLSSRATVRRFGHDFVFEIGLLFRAGEGGNSLLFDFTPLLLWRKPAIGLLDRWISSED